MIDKKIIKPFAYEIYKKSFQEIDEKTKENTFFLKNKLIGSSSVNVGRFI